MRKPKTYMEQLERQNKIKAMDGLLNSLPYLNDQIRKVDDQIDGINIQLEYGGIRSPSIMKEGTANQHSAQSPHERLIMKKLEYEAELKELMDRKSIVEQRIVALNPYEQKLIRMRYMDNKTYDHIAAEVNISRDVARRTIADILAKF